MYSHGITTRDGSQVSYVQGKMSLLGQSVRITSSIWNVLWRFKERIKAAPKGKAKPNRKVRCPFTANVVGGAAEQEMKVLDMIF